MMMEVYGSEFEEKMMENDDFDLDAYYE